MHFGAQTTAETAICCNLVHCRSSSRFLRSTIQGRTVLATDRQPERRDGRGRRGAARGRPAPVAVHGSLGHRDLDRVAGKLVLEGLDILWVAQHVVELPDPLCMDQERRLFRGHQDGEHGRCRNHLG